MVVQQILSNGLRSSDLILIDLPGTRSRIIRQNKNRIWCSKYERLKGLFRKDVDETLKFGRKICDSVAENMGNKGFFTTDERPEYGISYGISEDEYSHIFQKTGADEKQDLVVIFAYDREESEETKKTLDKLLEGIRAEYPNISVRSASEDDIPLILSFIRQLADYECLSHEVVATKESLHEALFCSPRVAEAVIGYYDGEPVAYAVFFERFHSFLGCSGLYLDNIYVRPEYRNQGMGNAIMNYLAGLAKKRDCSRMEWWVLSQNEPAIKFYSKFNAVPMNEWTVYRLSDNALSNVASRQCQIMK